MDKYLLGLNKKSFSLFYNGGEIWCEHLDSMYNKKELVLEKFKEDLQAISRPATSTHIIVNLDETFVDKELLEYIINSFNSLDKQLRKVAFVGLKIPMIRYAKSFETGFLINCFDDYEKAKEWII